MRKSLGQITYGRVSGTKEKVKTRFEQIFSFEHWPDCTFIREDLIIIFQINTLRVQLFGCVNAVTS